MGSILELLMRTTLYWSYMWYTFRCYTHFNQILEVQLLNVQLHNVQNRCSIPAMTMMFNAQQWRKSISNHRTHVGLIYLFSLHMSLPLQMVKPLLNQGQLYNEHRIRPIRDFGVFFDREYRLLLVKQGQQVPTQIYSWSGRRKNTAFSGSQS